MLPDMHDVAIASLLTVPQSQNITVVDAGHPKIMLNVIRVLRYWQWILKLWTVYICFSVAFLGVLLAG